MGIVGKHPDFVCEFNEAIANKDVRQQITAILSDCFRKKPESVERRVNELFGKAKPVYFEGEVGLASLWVELSKDFDPGPDKERLANLLRELSIGFQNKDEVFLEECISWVKGNLEEISSRPEEE